MNWLRTATAVIVFTGLAVTLSAEEPARRTPKEALQAFNDLIGTWNGTGTPEGTFAEKQKGFWTEKISWEWQFKASGDTWLKCTIDKGKYFTGGELRYLPEKDEYQLTVQTTDKETLVFTGKLDRRRLVADRVDEKKKENQRLVINMLHENERHLYHFEAGPIDKPSMKKLYQVGANRDGIAFAGKDDKPECVVSGGLGTMTVSYKGKTYYVCCSGCRDAFKDEPEKYIKEFEARKAKEKEKK